MSASEFAALLHAKRIGRGKWMAKCPAHADKRPSLAISEGNPRKGNFPFAMCCMSQGCTGDEILKAMGLTWKQGLGDKAVSRKEQLRADRERAEREEIRRNVRELVITALRQSAHWYAVAEKIAASMARMPHGNVATAIRYHEALTKARRFEAVADALDDTVCRGTGVPRFTPLVIK